MSDSKIVKLENSLPDIHELERSEQFLTVRLGSQIFGIAVLKVRDVLKPFSITNIPLSKPEIAGYINLRGRIVTVIDARKRLGIRPREAGSKVMNVVVEHDDELYALEVDAVGEAKTMKTKFFENNPANLSENWKEVSKGVFKTENELMLILDINKMLNF